MNLAETELIALDTREAARRLGVSPSLLEKIRCYAPESGPRFVKIGRRIVYRVSDLDAWASARTHGGSL